MKKTIGKNCKLLYTDTDSLIYEIRNVNIYENMKADIDKFDTSDYAEENPFGMPLKNKKVIGIMKDECNGHIMTEFIGLRSKMYSVLIKSQNPIKKAKGVKGSVVKTKITFEDYRNCLFNQSTIRCQQCNIRSRDHIVRTEKMNKIALSPYDDKRYLLPNETDTLPWGHYSILIQDLLLEDEEGAFTEVGDPVLECSVLEVGETGGVEVTARVGAAVGVGATSVVGNCLQNDGVSRTGIILSDDEQELEGPICKRQRVCT